MRKIVLVTLVLVLVGVARVRADEGVLPNVDWSSQMREVTIKETAAMQEVGYMAGTKGAPVELYLFADLTEEGFSGKVLKENIPWLLSNYPGKVAVWYIHFVLPYRDNPNLTAAMTTIECLSEQGTMWKNMAKLVDNKGQVLQGYELRDGLKFNECITNGYGSGGYREKILEGQRLMNLFAGGGAPTAVMVKKGEINGLMIVGAVPREVYGQTVDKLLAEPSPTLKQKEGIPMPAVDPVIPEKTLWLKEIWARLQMWWKGLWK